MNARLRPSEKKKSRWYAGLQMARPGLEPGTPRFSVVRSGLAGGAQSLENKRFSDSPLTRASRRSPLFTRFCTQFRRWRRLISFFRRRLERRDRRCLEEAALMSYTEPEATRVRSGEGLAQSRQGAAGWTRSRLPSSVQGGSGRREARVAEARWNPDGTRAPDVVPDV